MILVRREAEVAVEAEEVVPLPVERQLPSQAVARQNLPMMTDTAP